MPKRKREDDLDEAALSPHSLQVSPKLDEAPLQQQQPSKRPLQRKPLNFSIESIMQPQSGSSSPQQRSGQGGWPFSRSPSPPATSANLSCSSAGSTSSRSSSVAASPLSPRSGSSASLSSSPISPGGGGGACHSSLAAQQHQRHLHNQHSQHNQHNHHQHNSHQPHHQHHQQRQHHQQKQQAQINPSTSTSGGASASGSLDRVECHLENKDMWDKFHSLNTEMIITKTGRRMFPVMKVQFQNLDPNAKYAVWMDIVPVDNKRYRYAYHKSCWQVAGKADPSAEPRLYCHPDSPFMGDLLARQVISFEKVKLTNNEMDKSGHIILNSMHKYQPRVHLIQLKVPPQPLGGVGGPTTTASDFNTASGYNHRHHYKHLPQQQQHHQHHSAQQAQQQPQMQLDMETYKTFFFPETVFTAVTAYQNQLITKMKIDKNPFAKGFRDSSRLSDLDRNDPFDYMGGAGGLLGGPQGPPPLGARNHFSLGGAGGLATCSSQVGGAGGGGNSSLDTSAAVAVAAAAAAAGLPSHMDAYQQLLAASQNPWYSAAAACSTAQAAQQLQATQMWLAAISMLNGGGATGGLPSNIGGGVGANSSPGNANLVPVTSAQTSTTPLGGQAANLERSEQS